MYTGVLVSNLSCFSACNDTYFGVQCSSRCTCMERNTEDCNDVTGNCACKATWNGTNCDVDIDECVLGTHNCTSVQICNNIEDGWNCTCKYGESGGICHGKF